MIQFQEVIGVMNKLAPHTPYAVTPIVYKSQNILVVITYEPPQTFEFLITEQGGVNVPVYVVRYYVRQTTRIDKGYRYSLQHHSGRKLEGIGTLARTLADTISQADAVRVIRAQQQLRGDRE